MFQKTTLGNGLRVVTSTMPHTRSVCVGVYLAVGSRYEIDEQAGISHLVEHLCFKGTQRRRESKDICEAIEGIGGYFNGGTDKELTIYWVKVARSHFLDGVDVLEDMMCHSRFDPEDLEKERKIIVEELNRSIDTPQERVDMLIDELLWPGQPLGRDVGGSKETVNRITRAELLEFVSHKYVPENTVISVTGNISHEEVVAAITPVFLTWGGSLSRLWQPAVDSQKACRVRLETRKTEQAHLSLGVHAPSVSHPDRFAADMMNVVLGEGMSSRLFLELRERRGLAYDVHSYVTHFMDTGAAIVYTAIDPLRIEAAIEAILEQLARLKEERIPESEMNKVKEMAKGRLLLGLEDTRSVAGWLGGQEALNGRIRTVDEVVAIIESVTPEDIQRVARQMFRTEKLNLAVVGPVKGVNRLKALLKL